MKDTSEPATYKAFMVCLMQTHIIIILLASANTLHALKAADVDYRTAQCLPENN